MITVVGIFEQRKAAEETVWRLRFLGIDRSRIDLLSPGGSQLVSDVPTSENEAPGMAQTMGNLLGGAVGVAGGFMLGTNAVSFMLPGVGPVLALGSLGAAVLGLAGAIGGHAAGASVDRALLDGLSKDELFLYEDALRHGRCVVICLAQTELEGHQFRCVMAREGAESIDAAHHRYWLGLRDVVSEHYVPPDPRSDAHDDPFRSGFEAALNSDFRGKPWDQAVYALSERYRDWSEDAFRRGFECGQRFHDWLMHQAKGS